MAPRRIACSWVLGAALLAVGGCQRLDRGSESYVTGLRILGIVATPPEVSVGQTATLTALAVDTQGRPLDVAWAYCVAAPGEGSRFNTDCVTTDTASFLTPLASGLSTMLTMPAVDPAVLGSPDQSGGVYLPVRAKVSAGTDSYTAIYHLRVAMAEPPNRNPTLSGIYTVMRGAGMPVDGGSPDDGGTFTNGSDLVTAIDPATPLVVHAGDKLTLRALFAAGSAESYMAPGRPTDGGTGAPRKTTERLDVSFYATGGTLNRAFSGGTDGGMGGFMGGFMGGGQPADSVLTLDNNLPPSGGTIQLWAVGRDGRGGTDFVQRTLSFQ